MDPIDDFDSVPCPIAQLAHDVSLPFEGLRAGLLVNARVKSRLPDGLVLAFLGLFEGTVSWHHLGVDDVDDLTAAFPDNRRVRALAWAPWCALADR